MNPHDQEMMATVGEWGDLKIWRSKRKNVNGVAEWSPFIAFLLIPSQNKWIVLFQIYAALTAQNHRDLAFWKEAGESNPQNLSTFILTQEK